MALEQENTKSEVALREEKILEFWRENKTFEKSLKKDSPKGHYVFYDGPPFATGQIHYGHILGSTAKDAIGRYQTMRGYFVPRKWGWDCHGLPIENIVEKELNIAGHNEIERYGIDKFVEYARSKVLQYDADWRRGIERMGRWVDFDGGYKTMDNTFIESVWWALSELNKKNLIYEGVRVLAYCARCETPIANSEIAMDNSYKDIPDISVYVKFELEDEPNTFLLAWTTTPWTLPGNTAIAVNKDIEYVKIEHQGAHYILAKDTVAKVIKNFDGTTPPSFKGIELVGKKYKPVFPYYENTEIPNKENIYKVWSADFVTTEKGTGIAHEAPAFGEDDMNLAKENNIPWIIHVDETGRFKPEVTDFAGLKVKPKDTAEDKDAHLRSDIEVIKYLQKTGSYFDKEKIIHSYPHCMRCDTPIIYYAIPAWFVNIQKNKKDILRNAESMNWIPGHLKEGRFKNIMESAPDWNISRNRYWASPLPIWKCAVCERIKFVSSLQDIKENGKKSSNKYFVMRHGESVKNVKNISNSTNTNPSPLTSLGIDAAKTTAQNFVGAKLDYIFVSPLLRAQETAKIVSEISNVSTENIITDDRLTEIATGDFDGKSVADYGKFFSSVEDRFARAPKGGETLSEVKNRVGDFIYDVDMRYAGKNILVITHEDVVWMLEAAASGLDVKQIAGDKATQGINMAESRILSFSRLPRNKNYELDLHRPYIDVIELACECGGDMVRIPEVLDCWFESGSMPFAQDHYPFENPNWKKNNFPAGFVAEYIAQTRTWFYYSHIVSSLLFDHAPYKNVVTTGTLRAEDGHKMSKSKHNYPDPWIFIDKYGVDALRLYLMSSPLMKGEDANFSEKLVQEISSKIIGRLFNTLVFYELYRDSLLEQQTGEPNVSNILNKWILARLHQVAHEITLGMEAYDMALATRPIELFIEDLSTWYLRRSRERIKEGDKEAKQTLYFILKTTATFIAPFAPFAAEDMWQRLKNKEDEVSVHLENWPHEEKAEGLFGKILNTLSGGKTRNIDSPVITNMVVARNIVTLGLEARQKAGIKVRQPLGVLKVKNYTLDAEYTEILKDELNVKEIIGDDALLNEVELDTIISPELKEEGDYRELVRALQDMRKKLGLTPSESITLTVNTSEEGKSLIRKFEADLKKTVLVSELNFTGNDGETIKVDNLIFIVKIQK